MQPKHGKWVLVPILMCVWGDPHEHQAILGHQLGVLQFNSILALSTRRQHQIPHVKGSVLQDCFPSPVPSDAELQVQVLLTDWL